MDQCYISRVTSEVLDVCLKLEVTLEDEMCHSQSYFVYHYLTCCYIEAKVLAEVCIVEESALTKGMKLEEICEKSFYLAAKKVILGYQLLLNEEFSGAFLSFASISDSNLMDDAQICPDHLRYTAMFYTLAKCYMLYSVLGVSKNQ